MPASRDESLYVSTAATGQSPYATSNNGENVAVRIRRRRYEPGNYGEFKPTALDLEATSNRSDRAYPDDEEFVPERSGYRGAIVCTA
jgi:hypothetical protein